MPGLVNRSAQARLAGASRRPATQRPAARRLMLGPRQLGVDQCAACRPPSRRLPRLRTVGGTTNPPSRPSARTYGPPRGSAPGGLASISVPRAVRPHAVCRACARSAGPPTRRADPAPGRTAHHAARRPAARRRSVCRVPSALTPFAAPAHGRWDHQPAEQPQRQDVRPTTRLGARRLGVDQCAACRPPSRRLPRLRTVGGTTNPPSSPSARTYGPPRGSAPGGLASISVPRAVRPHVACRACAWSAGPPTRRADPAPGRTAHHAARRPAAWRRSVCRVPSALTSLAAPAHGRWDHQPAEQTQRQKVRPPAQPLRLRSRRARCRCRSLRRGVGTDAR
ncbi:UNVERIFIED_CONTAM: hypothetical protein RKD50_007180 [Streptomyces canus]